MANLVAEAERLGERFIARRAHHLAARFVSDSLLANTLMLCPKHPTLLDHTEDPVQAALGEGCRGVAQTLRQLATEGAHSFNLAWYSGAVRHTDEHCRLYATVAERPNDAAAVEYRHQRIAISLPRAFRGACALAPLTSLPPISLCGA